LISVFKDNTDKIIASSYNETAGVPVIFPEKYFDKLLLLKGDKGAKEFLQNHTSEIFKLKREHPFKDLDTQEEYQSYLKSV
jgi:molybdenum cofactor cytidylyltransferase